MNVRTGSTMFAGLVPGRDRAGGRARRRVLALVAAVSAVMVTGSLGTHLALAETGPTADTGGASGARTAAMPEKDWLHVDGNKIVDQAGNPVRLSGANWFGFNASERVFHGLWQGNITEITKSMAQRGINIVRVPISTQLLLEWKSGAAAATTANTVVNPELTGMNSLQIFDYWLALCEKYGLKVLLDVHSAEADNSGHIAPMWYKGSITPELYYQGWEWVTARYKNNDTIVAMDLKNEPHGKYSETPRAKWDDSTDVDNWKYTAETAAKRILAINPNLLILVEGIEVYPRAGASWSSQSEGDYHFNWWGGNLRGVAEHPIDLGSNVHQIVYSPHDYGPLVYEQPWFTKTFDKTTLTNDVWRPNWLYIHEQGIAPLLIGEWGGRLGQDERQDRWMTAMRDLIAEYGLHQTFWCLNPNSGDTGGLLLDDWKTWDETKYAMLKKALWQYDGKFVGLDHQVKLGGDDSTTGLSLADRYGGGGETGDTTAPSAPGKPTAGEVTATSAALSWTAATDDVGVVAYDVLRAAGGESAKVVATVSGTTYRATGLKGGTTYTFSVRARDAAGNVSSASPGLEVTTSAGGGNNGCSASYAVARSWQGGFQADVTVTNTGTAAINGWVVTWTPPSGVAVESLWNGKLTKSGSQYSVANEAHNGALSAAGTASFSFIGSGASTAPDSMSCTAS